MPDRPTAALTVAIALALPATLAITAGIVRQTTGIPVTRLVDAAFAALGVTSASPLPLRQAWYFGAYILAPLAGAAIAGSAMTGARPRWPLAIVATVAVLAAGFWTLWSLLDA